MKRLYEKNGEELVKLFKNIKGTGATLSLDMCLPDIDSCSGRVDWAHCFKKNTQVC